MLLNDISYVNAAIAVVVLFCLFNLRSKNVRHPSVKPANWCYPIIGHMIDFLPENLIQTCYNFPKIYGDLTEFYILSMKGLLVTNVELAKEIMMKTPKKFRRLRSFDYATKTMNLEYGLFHANGNVWNRIRRVTAPSFSNNNVQNKFPSVVREARNWIGSLAQQIEVTKGIVDMKVEGMALTLRVITAVAFGLEPDDPNIPYFFSADYMEDVYHILMFSIQEMQFPIKWLWRISPMYRYETLAIKANERFSKHCENVLAYKRKLILEKQITTASAMIDSLILRGEGAQSGEDALDQEIVSNIKTFYIAGAETTSSTITWAAYYLSTNPQFIHKLRAEMEAKNLFAGKAIEVILDTDIDLQAIRSLEYANAVVKETLRLSSPAFILGFELEDGVDSVKLSNGIELTRKDFVWLNIDGMQRKGDVFDHPGEFNPDRWIVNDQNKEKIAKQEEHFVAFGSGPRICPGMTLALTEAALAICFLVYAFDFSLACPPEEVQRIVVFAATPNKMPLKLTKRQL
ncbi:cytochrome P450 [archaeon]|nr:MAG: cytochrome P450 [archaeon]